MVVHPLLPVSPGGRSAGNDDLLEKVGGPGADPFDRDRRGHDQPGGEPDYLGQAAVVVEICAPGKRPPDAMLLIAGSVMRYAG